MADIAITAYWSLEAGNYFENYCHFAYSRSDEVIDYASKEF